MNGVAYFQRMALYNRWANQHVLDACADLDAGALAAPRAAFFPSIIRALDTELHARFDEFRAVREAQDAKIIAFTEQLDAGTLASDLSYQSMLAGAYTLPREMILAHMFNHQTHHRGQLHSMLIEAGVKPLAIDLVYYCLEADA